MYCSFHPQLLKPVACTWGNHLQKKSTSGTTKDRQRRNSVTTMAQQREASFESASALGKVNKQTKLAAQSWLISLKGLYPRHGHRKHHSSRSMNTTWGIVLGGSTRYLLHCTHAATACTRGSKCDPGGLSHFSTTPMWAHVRNFGAQIKNPPHFHKDLQIPRLASFCNLIRAGAYTYSASLHSFSRFLQACNWKDPNPDFAISSSACTCYSQTATNLTSTHDTDEV